MDWGAIIVGVLTTLGTMAGTFYTARRFGKLGIGPAQNVLNTIRRETIDAYEAQNDVLLKRIQSLEDDFRVCSGTLKRVEQENIELKDAIAELTLRERQRANGYVSGE
jgi:hypothetical protein